MHYTPNYKSKKCKTCDIFYNPLEVYEGRTPNNFEEGYRTQVLIDKKKKKVYVNADEVKGFLTENELNELRESGCVTANSEKISSLQKKDSSARGQSVKGRTSTEMLNKIKAIKERI